MLEVSLIGRTGTPRPRLYPISNSKLKFRVVTSATTKRVKRIALHISQKIICPGTSRFFQDFHAFSPATFESCVTDSSITLATDIGLLGNKNKASECTAVSKFWSQEPGTY